MGVPRPNPMTSATPPVRSVHLQLEDPDLARKLGGAQSENLKLIERRLGVRVGQRGTELHVSGSDEAVSVAVRLIDALTTMLKSGRALYPDDVEQAVKLLGRSGEEGAAMLQLPPVLTHRGKHIAPRSVAQRRYWS
jgi:phosphate starvation-inducible PhoH-like protein